MDKPGKLCFIPFPSSLADSHQCPMVKSALQDSHRCESRAYLRSARPAPCPGVSTTGSHGRGPWTWSLSGAWRSRRLLTVIVLPGGNGADSRSEFLYNVWDGQSFALSHTQPDNWEDATAGFEMNAVE